MSYSYHVPVPPAVKLENDTETFEHERVSSELKKQIQSARLAKKLTQAQVGGGCMCACRPWGCRVHSCSGFARHSSDVTKHL